MEGAIEHQPPTCSVALQEDSNLTVVSQRDGPAQPGRPGPGWPLRPGPRDWRHLHREIKASTPGLILMGPLINADVGAGALVGGGGGGGQSFPARSLALVFCCLSNCRGNLFLPHFVSPPPLLQPLSRLFLLLPPKQTPSLSCPG